ncbi:hypothetical protein [Devosia sp.]|uniref:hypothetical protein n=1 Tax=Devosia sp. TaxID=1871048 RepID=UPI002FCA7D7F
MDPIRRRMAIGIFATVKDVETTIARLDALGIHRHECFSLPLDQAPSELVPHGLDQAPVDLRDLHVPVSGHILLRVYLETVRDEQIVARALLESAAESVQLHDVNPPTTTPG